MKTLFNGVSSLPIKNIFNNLNTDNELTYNPKFIKEMNEIEKENPINITKYEDLFDDE